MKVTRANISPYQSIDFIDKECALLETIPAITYLHEDPNNAQILITNTHTDLKQIDLTQTKLIVHPNSGYDNIPFEFVKTTQIPIILGNTIRSHAVANYNLSCLLSHYGPLPHHPKWDQKRMWNRTLINEIKVLIIGDGHIGKLTRSSLEAIGAIVSSFDPYSTTGLKTLPTPLGQFDAIILTASLNPSSMHIINQNFLDQLSPNVLIINSARGALINQSNLLTFLNKNNESFAYLDVFEQEPFRDSFKHTNLHTTSHIAGVFKNIDQSILQFEYEVIKEFVELDIKTFRKKYYQLLLENRLKENYLL